MPHEPSQMLYSQCHMNLSFPSTELIKKKFVFVGMDSLW